LLGKKGLLDDPACVLAGALLAGGVAPLAPWPAACGFLVSVAALGRRWGAKWVALALVTFFIGGVRSELAYGKFEAERRRAVEFAAGPRRCAATVRVALSPVVRGGSLSWVADAAELDCGEGGRLSGVRLRLYGGPGDLARGDVVEVVAQLAPVRLFRNAELSNPLPAARRIGAVLSGSVLSAVRVGSGLGLPAAVDGARAHARARIEATFPPLAAPMARALVLGENDLDPVDDAAFKRSGLMHLLAVSGTHLVFAVVLLVNALKACLCRIERLARRFDVARGSAAFGVGASLLYADFSGGSGSAWRAAWMLSAVFLARSCGLRLGGARALGLSLLVGAAFDPLAAVDISFALSAAATWGLIVLGQPLARRCAALRSAPLRYVAMGSAATVTSTLPCAPLLALMDERLTAAGLVANLLAAPLGELAALPACLLHAAVSFFPALEQGLALVGAGSLLGVRWVALRSAEASFASFVVPLPSAWQLSLLVSGTVLVGACRRRRWRLAVALASLSGLVSVELGLRERPVGRLAATMLDVGQGDATLVEFPEGSRMLIDGGGFPHGIPDPGQRVLLPLLRARRVSELEVVVLSHAHADHMQGLLAVLERHRVAELWHPAGAAPENHQYAELLRLARAQGTRLLGPAELCGNPRRFGDAVVRVVGPCPVAPGAGLNDNSLVLHVRFGARSVLFAGDAERDQEGRLLAAGAELRADVLKTGHHGSDTSTGPDFLAAVAPRWATISAGVRNRFEHPRPSTLRALEARGVAVLRTDRSGSLTVTTDGDAVRWQVFDVPWGKR
jgi:competence protein ComEC